MVSLDLDNKVPFSESRSGRRNLAPENIMEVALYGADVPDLFDEYLFNQLTVLKQTKAAVPNLA